MAVSQEGRSILEGRREGGPVGRKSSRLRRPSEQAETAGDDFVGFALQVRRQGLSCRPRQTWRGGIEKKARSDDTRPIGTVLGRMCRDAALDPAGQWPIDPTARRRAEPDEAKRQLETVGCVGDESGETELAGGEQLRSEVRHPAKGGCGRPRPPFASGS